MNLARYLADNDCEVILISRHPPAEDGRWTHARWDGRTFDEWANHLDGAAALVNLAGRSVDCIKTPDHCDEILRSRVQATRVRGQALRRVQTPPPVWVQLPPAHHYGAPPAVVASHDAEVVPEPRAVVGRACSGVSFAVMVWSSVARWPRGCGRSGRGGLLRWAIRPWLSATIITTTTPKLAEVYRLASPGASHTGRQLATPAESGQQCWCCGSNQPTPSRDSDSVDTPSELASELGSGTPGRLLRRSQ